MKSFFLALAVFFAADAFALRIIDAEISIFPQRPAPGDQLAIGYYLFVQGEPFVVNATVTRVGQNIEVTVFLDFITGFGFPPANPVSGRVNLGPLPAGTYHLSLHSRVPAFDNLGRPIGYADALLVAQREVTVTPVFAIPSLSPVAALLLAITILMSGLAVQRDQNFTSSRAE